MGQGEPGNNISIALLDSGIGQNYEVKDYGGDSLLAFSDKSGHGTFLAGIISGRLNNRLGAGIAPESSINIYKCLDDNGVGTDAVIVEKIYEAIEKGDNIINLSFGGPQYSGLYERPLKDAYQKGTFVVAAVGNDGGDIMTYPSCMNYVITVAATNTSGQRYYSSNYGSFVDFAAPGEKILSCVPENAYGAVQD